MAGDDLKPGPGFARGRLLLCARLDKTARALTEHNAKLPV
jgi:hypothetical protein